MFKSPGAGQYTSSIVRVFLKTLPLLVEEVDVELANVELDEEVEIELGEEVEVGVEEDAIEEETVELDEEESGLLVVAVDPSEVVVVVELEEEINA